MVACIRVTKVNATRIMGLRTAAEVIGIAEGVLENLPVGWRVFKIRNLVAVVHFVTENLYWEFIELENLNLVKIVNKKAITARTVDYYYRRCCNFGNLS